MRLKRTLFLTLAGAMALVATAAPQKSKEKTLPEDVRILTQEGGKTLGYSTRSGIKLLTVDNLTFKDLNRNGALDKYEDWRLSYEERAQDLVKQLSIEEIAGLMLYSPHQSVPAAAKGFGSSTYQGKPFDQSGASPADLSDGQKKFLTEDNLRHILITKVESPAIAAQWNNNVQAWIEGIGHGIPANNSTDPRHGTTATTEYNYGSGGDISQWPSQLGLAATFSPALVEQFGDIASREYRALGITTALSPQIDLATEPRWSRTSGTFGEDIRLSTDLARAYCDGYQSSDDANGGWGMHSVNVMVKHWPGGGPEEGGRDGHFGYGKFAVYPGNYFEKHLLPFTEGAFKLSNGTEKAASVMPYYTISLHQNGGTGSNRGNSYNRYIITDLLRNKYQYDGVVCTDWMVTMDCHSTGKFEGKCWGAENLSVAQRHYEIIKAGVDQFGGNCDKLPVLQAYQMGVDEYGSIAMRARFEASGIRLLMNIFRTGLFENPYLDPTESEETVGCPAFMKAGYEAQLKSIVLLKNKGNLLPMPQKKKVYMPQRFRKGATDWFGIVETDTWEYPAPLELVKQYYQVVDTPQEADFAMVFIESPDGGTGHSEADRQNGGNGYLPISLQYADYTAENARAQSLAGGAPDEAFLNRTYKDKSAVTNNKTDLGLVLDTRKKMGNKPVIVSLKLFKPCVVAEFEQAADAIVVNFETQAQAVLDVISGKAEPSGLLPMQMPADMRTVEEQKEDVPRDMKPYVDSEGNRYDFAFGLNWKGVIKDKRVEAYY